MKSQIVKIGVPQWYASSSLFTRCNPEFEMQKGLKRSNGRECRLPRNSTAQDRFLFYIRIKKIPKPKSQNQSQNHKQRDWIGDGIESNGAKDPGNSQFLGAKRLIMSRCNMGRNIFISIQRIFFYFFLRGLFNGVSDFCLESSSSEVTQILGIDPDRPIRIGPIRVPRWMQGNLQYSCHDPMVPI